MTIKGSCHCGATTFEVESAPSELTQCTCSLCSKRGALWAYYTPRQVTIALPSTTATYRWQSKSVAHHFCPHCGCTTYTETPDWSRGEPDFANMRVALKPRLFDDFNLSAVPVTVIDGKTLW
jgi:hypothetical protein